MNFHQPQMEQLININVPSQMLQEGSISGKTKKLKKENHFVFEYVHLKTLCLPNKVKKQHMGLDLILARNVRVTMTPIEEL